MKSILSFFYHATYYINQFKRRLFIGRLFNFVTRVARTQNKGLNEMAGALVNQIFVHLIDSCGRLTVCASKSASSLSRKNVSGKHKQYLT